MSSANRDILPVKNAAFSFSCITPWFGFQSEQYIE
jgi:hypothetical protein